MTSMLSALPRLSISPGGLLNIGESICLSVNTAGEIIIRRGENGAFSELTRTRLGAGGKREFRWTPPECGMFVVEFIPECDRENPLRKPVAVVADDWAVCQITVGSFTSEDFADIIHDAGVAADYYVARFPAERIADFTCSDPRWPAYERLRGDAIHPHAMADAFGDIDPALDYGDPNWDSLSPEAIDARLHALQAWWVRRGFAPLDRIATYTPSNRFVEACGRMGIGVLHSLVPEQNWSDGDWSINHWGMPTCPFWIAADDYRKAGARGGLDARTPVLGMTMNHYHVVSPHLTHWGDFVLSPSHFTRWIRAADAGGESLRFRQFLSDTVRGGSTLGHTPFFFVAGFEFGRTFGTADMTEWNRAGLRRLIAMARTEKLVFATSRDVYAYHLRHVPTMAERIFRQRDSWLGVTVNGKPGQCGDSIVIERAGYKAVIREDSSHPWLYYDYGEPWNFATNDVNAPHDHAAACAESMAVALSPARDSVKISANIPLSRATPIALWDVALAGELQESAQGIAKLPVAMLDDGRTVEVLEFPKGWSGMLSLPLEPKTEKPARRDEGLWRLQAFGSSEGTIEPHFYLHLDAALMRDVRVTFKLSKPARIEGAGASGLKGDAPAGPLALEFGPLKPWYRFFGCGLVDLELPDAEATQRQLASASLPGQKECERLILAANDACSAEARAHPALAGKQLLFEMYCGAALPHGTRSRAEAYDMPVVHKGGAGITAKEFADGVMAFGPGQAFWYHPRGLCARIYGLDAQAARKGSACKWTILLHSFAPLAIETRYKVFVGANRRAGGDWAVPVSEKARAAFFALEVTPQDLDAQGRLSIILSTDQKQILYWWRERGFIAALHALWVAE